MSIKIIKEDFFHKASFFLSLPPPPPFLIFLILPKNYEKDLRKLKEVIKNYKFQAVLLKSQNNSYLYNSAIRAFNLERI